MRNPETKFSAPVKTAFLARAPRMVIDTSALAAILLGEPERKPLIEHTLPAEAKRIAAANSLETEPCWSEGGGKPRAASSTCLSCGQSWKSFLWMPSKGRLRVPRGASMRKSGMRRVSTSETASPIDWPSSQGRNSWQKERVFG